MKKQSFTTLLIILLLVLFIGCSDSLTNNSRSLPDLPIPPDNIRAFAQGDSGVMLRWNDRSTNEYGFRIFERIGSDTVASAVDTVLNDIESFLLNNRNPDSSYYYSIQAFNGWGPSVISEETGILDPSYIGAYSSGSIGWITSIDVSADGRRLAIGAGIHRANTVECWDIATGELIFSDSDRDPVPSVVMSPNGLFLSAVKSYSHTINVWNVETGDLVVTLDEPEISVINDIAISADGLYIAAATGFNRPDPDSAGQYIWEDNIFVWEFGRWTAVDHIRNAHKGQISAVEFSTDGNYMGSFMYANEIKIWNLPGFGQFRALQTPSSQTIRLIDIAFYPNKNQIAAVCDDDHIRVWNIDTGTVGFQIFEYTKEIRSIAFSFDGKFLVTANENENMEPRIWDYGRRELAVMLPEIEGKSPGSLVDFTPDGKFLIIADMYQIHKVKLYR